MKWRPIKTAPLDTNVVLKYPSVGMDTPKSFVGVGRWIDVPHLNVVLQMKQDGKEIPLANHDPHWEVAYVAVLEMGAGLGGNTHYSFEARSVRVRPTHWQPIPKA